MIIYLKGCETKGMDINEAISKAKRALNKEKAVLDEARVTIERNKETYVEWAFDSEINKGMLKKKFDYRQLKLYNASGKDYEQQIKNIVNKYMQIDNEDLKVNVGIAMYFANWQGYALQLLSEAVEKENPEALFYAGLIYNEGTEVQRDLDKVSLYMQQSANKNFNLANLWLAKSYITGKGIMDADFDKGLECLKNASENGEYLIAYIELVRNRKIENLEYLLKASKFNVERKHNLLNALNNENVTMILEKREETEEYEYLMKLYALVMLEAIALGEENLKYFMSTVCDVSEVEEKEINQEWMKSICLSRENQEKDQEVKSLLQQAKGDQIQECYDKIKKIAEENKNAVAEYYIGYKYFSEENYDEAFKFIERAANQNLPEACGWMSYMYKNGFGCEIDKMKVLEYDLKGAMLNSNYCIKNMGMHYYTGYGVEVDLLRAEILFRKSNFELGLGFVLCQFGQYSEAKEILEKHIDEGAMCEFYLGYIYLISTDEEERKKGKALIEKSAAKNYKPAIDFLKKIS